MTTTYQVGRLIEIDAADPKLSDETAALKLAVSESIRDETTAFGVWTGQDHGSELVAIAYMGELFRK